MAELLSSLPESDRKEFLASLTDTQAETVLYDWKFWARPNQLPPGGNWRYWLNLGGRGAGKTRTGAETIRAWVSAGYGRIHLVGGTAADVRDVMVEGESGLLRCFPPGQRPIYEPSRRKITFHNGAEGHCYSADEPERLRGPQCEAFWADELAAWRFPEAWDNLIFGFRLGKDPRGVITTTPKPKKLIRNLVKDPNCVVTRASSYENRAHLAGAFFDAIIRKYEGTRIGRQELEAELLEDLPGALWQRNWFDRDRLTRDQIMKRLSDREDRFDLARVVVAIDPAVTSGESANETGIVVIARSSDDHAYVLADKSGRYTPQGWAQIATNLFVNHHADCVVGEINNGGELVEANLRAYAEPRGILIPFHAVHASRGKIARAEPIAVYYEQRRVHHVGPFDDLEDQCCIFEQNISHREDTDERDMLSASPDRVDALVWGLTELFLDQRPIQAHVIYQEPQRVSPY